MIPWSKWLEEGFFYSFRDEQRIRHYFTVLFRDWAHLEYTWEEDIAPGGVSGPTIITNLETTKESQIWQLIFGLKPDAYIYVYLPTDVSRHGTAKVPTNTASLREVGHYRQQDSPFDRPSMITEHFLIKPHTPFIALQAYNPTNITFQSTYNPVKINFVIAKCEMEMVGTEAKGELEPAAGRFTETLDKLYRRVIPHRPLTLWPVRAPAKGV